MQVNFNGNINSTYKTSNTSTSKAKKAAKTAAEWFAFGVGLDLFNYKFTAVKSPVKKSLFVNTMVALGAAMINFLPKKNSKKLDKTV